MVTILIPGAPRADDSLLRGSCPGCGCLFTATSSECSGLNNRAAFLIHPCPRPGCNVLVTMFPNGPALFLWRLLRATGPRPTGPSRDEVVGFVVSAPTADAARLFASNRRGGDLALPSAWTNPLFSTCDCIGQTFDNALRDYLTLQKRDGSPPDPEGCELMLRDLES